MELRDEIIMAVATLHRRTAARKYFAETEGMSLACEWMKETDKALGDLTTLLFRYIVQKEPVVAKTAEMLYKAQIYEIKTRREEVKDGTES